MDLLRGHLPQLKQALTSTEHALQGSPEWGQRPAPRGRLGWISWRTFTAAVLLGGILHICAVFAASQSATGQAYELLREGLPRNRMMVLQQQAPGKQILPWLAPDMLYAMCRYDLSEGPVAVAATVLAPGWALSLHSPMGTNFYVLPGQAQRHLDVSFVITPSGPDAAPLPIRRESSDDTQVASPTSEGLVVLRAPLRGLAWTAEAEAALQAASCAPARR
jgi:uncharacterized membrane protein